MDVPLAQSHLWRGPCSPHKMRWRLCSEPADWVDVRLFCTFLLCQLSCEHLFLCLEVSLETPIRKPHLRGSVDDIRALIIA